MTMMDPSVKVSGHSLRISVTTEALAKGVPLELVKVGGRWKLVESISRYQRGEALVASDFTSTLFSTRN